MFDINTAINTAIATAVAEATRPLLERIAVLEETVDINNASIATLNNRLNEAAPAVQVDEAKMVEALNSQEWFWEKLSRFVTDNSSITVEDLHMVQRRVTALEGSITVEDLHMVQRRVTALEDARYQGALSRSDVEALIEAAINDHCETYDHDQYDEVYNEWGGESPDEFVRDDDLRGTVEEVMNSASFEVTVRL
jgi:hypothetical protein